MTRLGVPCFRRRPLIGCQPRPPRPITDRVAEGSPITAPDSRLGSAYGNSKHTTHKLGFFSLGLQSQTYASLREMEPPIERPPLHPEYNITAMFEGVSGDLSIGGWRLRDASQFTKNISRSFKKIATNDCPRKRKEGTITRTEQCIVSQPIPLQCFPISINICLNIYKRRNFIQLKD